MQMAIEWFFLLNLDIARGIYGGLKLLGVLAPTTKGNYLVGPNSWWRDKRFLDGGQGATSKVLEVNMGEVVWPHHPRPNGKASMGVGPMWRHA